MRLQRRIYDLKLLYNKTLCSCYIIPCFSVILAFTLVLQGCTRVPSTGTLETITDTSLMETTVVEGIMGGGAATAMTETGIFYVHWKSPFNFVG
jgi:hypothetical protein